MKQGWEEKILGVVCENLDSRRKPITKRDRISGDIPYYGATGIVDYVNDYIFNEKLVLLGEDGAKWGKDDKSAFIITGKTWVNNHAHVLRPNRKILMDEWLVYFLNSQDLTPYISGMTVPKLNQGKMNEIKIPIAPVHEQKHIVSILDEVFASIAKAKANAEQNLKNARELFQSYLNDYFQKNVDGWEEKTLREVCKISSKLIDPRIKDYSDLLHVGGGNIVSKVGTLSDLKTAKEEKLISGKFLFDETMVLYSKIRPYLMKVVKCEFVGLCSADIYPLVPVRGVMIRDFLYYLLLTDKFTEYAIQGSQRAGMPKVNRDHLFGYRFHLPPLSVQKAIVQLLDNITIGIRKLEANYQQKLIDLEELKKSILQKAFSGELKTS